MPHPVRQYGFSSSVSAAFKNSFMVYLKAFLDKSGDAGKPVVVVGGFIAEPTAWDRMEAVWDEATQGIEDFRMSDLIDRTGEFSDPSWTEERCEALGEKLVSVVADNVIARGASGVDVEEFSNSKLGKAKRYVGDPYRLCCSDILIGASTWAMKSSADKVIEFVFDQDGKFYNRTNMIYHAITQNKALVEKFRIAGIHFSNRRFATGLRIADAFANLTFRYQCSRFGNGRAEQHPYLLAFRGDGKNEIGHFYGSAKAIEWWADKLLKHFSDMPKRVFRQVERQSQRSRRKT
jgi:Protein of unknown function (DUF3800)